MGDMFGVGQIGSAFLGYLGNERTNQNNMDIMHENSAFNAAEAEKNRNFQGQWTLQAQNYNSWERMQKQAYDTEQSNTAVQRRVADLKSAGLNPMLAYSGAAQNSPGGQGSSSAPHGGQAQAAQNATQTNSLAAALQAASLFGHSAMQMEQSKNIEADTELKRAQKLKEVSSSGHLDAVTDQIRQEMKTFEDRWEKLKHQLGITRNEYYETEGRRMVGAQAGDLTKHPAVVKMVNEGQKLANEARLLGLKVPEAIQEARFWTGERAGQAMNTRHSGTWDKTLTNTISDTAEMADRATKWGLRMGNSAFDINNRRQGPWR